MDVDLDRERVARQITGLSEDRVGLAGAGQGVPGEELLVGEGAPEVAGAPGGGVGGGLRASAGIARDDLPAADEPITALVSDGLSDAPRLRYITNLHTCPGKQFLRRKSTPEFHPRATAARSASSQSVMPHQRRNRSPESAALF